MVPFPPRFAPPRVEVTPRADGTTIVRSPVALGEVPRAVTTWLSAWAERAPDRTFLMARGADGYDRLSYRDALAQVRACAAGLLARGASAERPAMILSENSISHAILSLAAMHVGVPAVPVSVAYSVASKDHAKLRRIAAKVTPSVVFAEDGSAFARALEAIAASGATVVTRRGHADGAIDWDALAISPGPEVDRAHAEVGHDTVAKILFTSGSTGEPKGVINTHHMLAANQRMIAQLWPFLEDEPPVLVDWLPWSHTFGGNHNFNMVLMHGGTLLINEGKPVPALSRATVDNLCELPPTLYFDVPRGYEVLLGHLEENEALRARFFSRLRLAFYAAAALPQTAWDRMDAVSRAARGGEPIPMVSAWGSTETSPLVTSVHFPIPRAGVIGLPAPGCEIKLVPSTGKLEMRVRGPNVTPGYWRAPELTEVAFDEEGFYLIGDAGRFEDPEHPEKGLVFDGRVSESFKLTTGTWVNVGTLRVELIAACAPFALDAVVTGHDRDEVGMMIVPDAIACRRAAGLSDDAPLDEVTSHPEVRAGIARGMRAHGEGRGSAHRAERALVLLEPPSIDHGEITDKGYLNQRAMLERRAELVTALYDDADPRVIRSNDA
ncbi:MAG: feruloyl-CoA synthase [Sandaracinaceae bacterium]